MDASPESGRNNRLLNKPVVTAAFLAAVLLLSSCGRTNVIVISDPYIETLSDGWKPSGAGFRFAGWLRGYAVASVTVEDSDELENIIGSNADVFDVLVISPYHAGHVPGSIPEGKRIIVAGGYPPEGAEGYEYLVPDRTGVMAEIGEIAAEGGYEGITLLVSLTTPARTREFSALMDSYVSHGGLPEKMRTIDLSGEPGREVPGDFTDKIGDADLLLLLAGSANYNAYISTEEDAIPVITEKAVASGMQNDRIIGSIEENRRAFGRALMDQIADSGEVMEKTYPIRLSSR